MGKVECIWELSLIRAAAEPKLHNGTGLQSRIPSAILKHADEPKESEDKASVFPVS